MHANNLLNPNMINVHVGSRTGNSEYLLSINWHVEVLPITCTWFKWNSVILVPKFPGIHKINRLFLPNSCNETKLVTIADVVSQLNSKPVLVQVPNEVLHELVIGDDYIQILAASRTIRKSSRSHCTSLKYEIGIPYFGNPSRGAMLSSFSSNYLSERSMTHACTKFTELRYFVLLRVFKTLKVVSDKF
jgi:hypothetical protein